MPEFNNSHILSPIQYPILSSQALYEIPAHNHLFNQVRLDSAGSGGLYSGGEWKVWLDYGVPTTDVGGGQPHNNMPPYMTVYMYKRIA